MPRAEDCGNALSGLTSSQISSGRFDKAAYYTTFVREARTPDEAAVTLANILNDRPYSLAEDPPGAGGDGPAMSETTTEVTTFTWMNDKARNRSYLRAIDQMNFATFEIDKLASITKIVAVPFAHVSDFAHDGTALLLSTAEQ